MKNLTKTAINILAIVAIILLSSQFSSAKTDTINVITVQSGKTIIKLTAEDERYLVSQVPAYRIWTLRFHSNLVKNNDTADFIIAILKARKTK